MRIVAEERVVALMILQVSKPQTPKSNNNETGSSSAGDRRHRSREFRERKQMENKRGNGEIKKTKELERE